LDLISADHFFLLQKEIFDNSLMPVAVPSKKQESSTVRESVNDSVKTEAFMAFQVGH